jgi:hypothetical protein
LSISARGRPGRIERAEFLEGYDEHFSTQAKQAIQRWVVAITAYEASRDFKPAPPTVNAERKPS